MKHPSLYEINTRVRLRELGAATLDEIPDAELDRLVSRGFDWVWMLGVWQTGEVGRAYSRSLFPGVNPAAVCGSCFAVTAYDAHSGMGGTPALLRLRDRLHRRGLRLMLDFVPNHTAVDHPWAAGHPEYYVPGDGPGGLAHGRDPNFPPWPDTLQLNYANPALQEMMIGELLKVAACCDGVRCDMAMLLLPDIFRRTWNLDAADFWPRALAAVRERYPEFRFMAEVYWDLEWTLQQKGFDYCYDKRLYDRLRSSPARTIRDHLKAGFDYQKKLSRFLENHDEPRAAAVFPEAQHRAAAVVTYFAPGLRFFQDGQLGGRKQSLPVHLCRSVIEPANPKLQRFYLDLLALLPQGEWRLLDCLPGWDGNPTHEDVIVYSWPELLVVVNYSAHRSQCYVEMDVTGPYRLTDTLGDECYERTESRLYLDLPEWGYNVFRVQQT